VWCSARSLIDIKVKVDEMNVNISYKLSNDSLIIEFHKPVEIKKSVVVTVKMPRHLSNIE